MSWIGGSWARRPVQIRGGIDGVGWEIERRLLQEVQLAGGVKGEVAGSGVNVMIREPGALSGTRNMG